VLDALRARLGTGAAMRRLLNGRRLDGSAERVLFALVANPGAGPVVQAGRGPLDQRGRADPGPDSNDG
jgi:hypothetical protein